MEDSGSNSPYVCCLDCGLLLISMPHPRSPCVGPTWGPVSARVCATSLMDTRGQLKSNPPGPMLRQSVSQPSCQHLLKRCLWRVPWRAPEHWAWPCQPGQQGSLRGSCPQQGLVAGPSWHLPQKQAQSHLGGQKPHPLGRGQKGEEPLMRYWAPRLASNPRALLVPQERSSRIPMTPRASLVPPAGAGAGVRTGAR